MRRLAVAAGLLLLVACGESGASPSASVPAVLHSVSFSTSDGIRLSGHAGGSGLDWVVFTHEYPGDETGWFDLAQRLAGEGYGVLTYNVRGYAPSGGDKDIAHIDRDVLAAVAFATQQGARSVWLVGASMGAAASFIAATELPGGSPALRGVVSLSGVTEFMGLRVGSAPRSVTAPALCIAGAQDQDGAIVSAARLLCGQALHGSTVVVSSSAHGTALLRDPVVGASVMSAVEQEIRTGGG